MVRNMPLGWIGLSTSSPSSSATRIRSAERSVTLRAHKLKRRRKLHPRRKLYRANKFQLQFQAVTIAILRLLGIVPHQLVHQLSWSSDLAQPILEAVAQRIKRMPIALFQAVRIQVFVHGGRERITSILVAREAIGKGAHSLKPDADERNVAE